MIRLALTLALLAPGLCIAAPQVTDIRYCGTPERTADGSIKRSDSVTRRFQYLYPCPSTGNQIGPCPGWQKDHVIPLAEGGCDAVHNMQWLPSAIKSCPGRTCKDRWERTVYRRAAS